MYHITNDKLLLFMRSYPMIAFLMIAIIALMVISAIVSCIQIRRSGSLI